VLPFGLTNAPATFQVVMNKLFSQNKYNADGIENPMRILSEFVLVFIDDILIINKTSGEHKKHINIVVLYVLQLLRNIRYSLNHLNVYGDRLSCLTLATLWGRMASSLNLSSS